MNITGFIPQSFSDWPGKTAAVIFTQGCNMQCGFCQNAHLVPIRNTGNYADAVLKKLTALAWSIDGVVITGGEPTLQEDLASFLTRLKNETKLQVKLDTNGTNPKVLKRLIDNKLVDYIAMDIKAPLEKYKLITKFENKKPIAESIITILDSNVPHEFRTTFIPQLLNEEDIKEIIKLIPNANRYALQQFTPHNCLDSKYDALKSPTTEQLTNIAKKLDFKGEIKIRSGSVETTL